MNNKKLVLLVPTIIVTLVVIFLISALNNKDTINQANIEHKAFPKFVLNELTSNQAISEQIFVQQEYALLNIWASWCVVCKTEHPFLLTLANQGIHIIGLNYRDNQQAALSVLEKTGNPYQQVIFDEKGALALDLGVVGTPETYLVNQQGIIIARFNGVLTESVWETIFADPINELSHNKGS